jgi:hypothetical protein
MGPLIGIPLTIVACVAALGTWGRTIQIISIIILGLACVHTDLKAER